MTVQIKICGLRTAATLDAAVAAGAAFVGFVFYPPSPRALRPSEAAELATRVPPTVRKVGLVVDEDDEALDALVAEAPLDMLQLHGGETPERTAAIRARLGLPVMKAIPVADAADIDRAGEYAEAADWILFDAKPPADRPDALPGGNAIHFEWDLLAGRSFALPWMLSGGLTPDNVVAAVGRSGAAAVDVSSGVESARGVKEPELIRAFCEAVRAGP